MKTASVMNVSTQTTDNDAPTWFDSLPKVRGRYRVNAPLDQSSWFRVGGPAEALFKPEDVEDLQVFLKNCPSDIPVTVLGVASNCIIRDGGIRGVVIRLGRTFASIQIDENNPEQIIAGAAALDANVARFAQENGLTGLEFYSGIPGTIGGALRMNAGCYGIETSNVCLSARAIDRQGNLHNLTTDEMSMSYRHSDVPEDWIFVDAIFQAQPGDKSEIQNRMEEIKSQREGSQPIRERTGGSTFANPERDTPGAGSAWKAIDAAGCRGLEVGGAQMSEKHCNFMINTGTATADNLETLGETVRRRVKENSGIDLRWEIKRIGEAVKDK